MLEPLQPFRDWLIDEVGLSARTAATYCRCVRASRKRNQILAVIRDPNSPTSTRTLYRAALTRWATFRNDGELLTTLKSPKMSREVRSGSKKLPKRVRPIPPDQMQRFIMTLDALREMDDVPSWVWPSLSLLRKLALRAGVDLCQIRREAVIEALETGVLRIWTKGERVRELPTRQVQDELFGLLDLGPDWEILADVIAPTSRIACRMDTAYRQVADFLKAVAKAADIEPREIHSHRFRHTRALELYKKSKDVRLVQKFLGHRSLETTQHYLQVSIEEMDDYMDDME